MSKKKLVVSGDSWVAPAYAAPRCASYIDGRMKSVVSSSWINIKPEIIFWPENLGEMLNMDVVNLGLAGVGNEFIYNRIVDKLSSTKDVGLAITCWSGHVRWDLNSISRWGSLTIDPSVSASARSKLYLTNKLKPLVDLILENDLVSTEYNFFKSLRWYNAFQNYCESNNIPYMQCSAFNMLSNDIISLMLDHPIFYKMNEDHFYGWPMFAQIGGFNLSNKLNEVDPEMKNLRVSDEDLHPNTEGHKIISELLYKQYEFLYGLPRL